MNALIAFAFLGLVTYASAGAIVSPLGLGLYGAPIAAYGTTDLAGAIGITQGKVADFHGKVADYHGKIADAQGKYADYLGKVSDAQAKAANYANRVALPYAHSGIIAAPAAYGLAGLGYAGLGYANAPLIF